MPPTIATAGTPARRQRPPTPPGTFPKEDCQSSRPSPVTTREAPLSFLSNSTRSRTVSIPGFISACRNTARAAPRPPAAPDPSRRPASGPYASIKTSSYRRIPCSRRSSVLSVPPFWAPKVRVAPSGPVSGFLTSHITVKRAPRIRGQMPVSSIPATLSRSFPLPESSFPSLSRKRIPNARMAPMPPSFVALPPIAMVIRRYPRSRASRIICPVPKEVVSRGSRSSGRKSGRPEAAAISIRARSSSRPAYAARIRLPRGSRTSVSSKTPPRACRTASIVPSPPSATGRHTHSQSGKHARASCFKSSAISMDDRDPLNESDANTNFITNPLSAIRPPGPSRSPHPRDRFIDSPHSPKRRS